MKLIEEAMHQAMTSPECYQKPTQETMKPKGKVISSGVSAITEALEEQKQKDKAKKRI